MRLKNKLLTLASIAVVGTALTFGLSCNEHELTPFSTSLVSGKKQIKSSGSARAVDIIFIVDNSNSMIEEQRGLDENFYTFLEKLVTANADFRLAAVDTSYDINGVDKNFNIRPNENLLEAVTRSKEKAQEILQSCKAYFSNGKNWIESSDFIHMTDADRLATVQDYFRCQALIGTNGSPVERGLATLTKSLEKESTFKRDGSILAIVFVTDENDCSDNKTDGPRVTDKNVEVCETHRNIEDSCIMTRFDTIRTDAVNGSELLTAPGQPITYGDETKTLREWCVEGTEKSREALEACLAQGDDCPASAYIDCPEVEGVKTCKNALDSRRVYYQKITELVEKSNMALYRAERPELYDGSAGLTPNQIRTEKDKMASADVIVASIINRDRGIRYDTTLPETWCGEDGSQSYRYQFFAEMFDNDPIYAPICCKNEIFATAQSSSGDGMVCSMASKVGENGAFGPVLGAIGKRIGEAVNTICADTPPITCRPEDCNVMDENGSYTDERRDKASAACTCTRGCNTQVYFGNSERAYYLCNEFRLSVGSIDSDSNYSSFELDKDFRIDYESNYCHARTGSPIQINLNRVETGQSLIIEYPKRVSSM